MHDIFSTEPGRERGILHRCHNVGEDRIRQSLHRAPAWPRTGENPIRPLFHPFETIV